MLAGHTGPRPAAPQEASEVAETASPRPSRTDRNGVTTVINTTHAFGTATDQAGNSYVFNYANSFNVSNTGPTDPVFTGRMVDSFSLAGSGPARLTNGFQAGITTDLATFFTFEELNSRGDPIDFATGEELCDPL